MKPCLSGVTVSVLKGKAIVLKNKAEVDIYGD